MTAKIHHFSDEATSRSKSMGMRILTWCVVPLAMLWLLVLAPVVIISLSLCYCAYIIISVAFTGKFWRIQFRTEAISISSD